MLMGAVCDACKLTLLKGVTALQVTPGKIIASPSGPALRGTGSPEAYFLCNRCSAAVKQTLHRLVRGDGAARPKETDESARRAS